MFSLLSKTGCALLAGQLVPVTVSVVLGFPSPRELISSHPDNLGTVLRRVVANELTQQVRTGSNLLLLTMMIHSWPEESCEVRRACQLKSAAITHSFPLLSCWLECFKIFWLGRKTTLELFVLSSENWSSKSVHHISSCSSYCLVHLMYSVQTFHHMHACTVC